MPLLVSWNVLCWNVRGLNSEANQLALSNAINSSGCAVICLQETKKSSFDNAFIKSCCPQQFDKYDFIPSRGASGGIATIWNSVVFTATIVASEEFGLLLAFTPPSQLNLGP